MIGATIPIGVVTVAPTTVGGIPDEMSSSDPTRFDGFELLDHEGGFRAILPVRGGMLSTVQSMKFGNVSGINGLSVGLAMVFFLPVLSVSRLLPGTGKAVLFGVAFGIFALVLHLLRSGIEENPVRIVDLDLGRVRVCERNGKVLFDAPLEEVKVRIWGGLHLEAGEAVIKVETMASLGPLLQRFERARVQRGTVGDVPPQMEQLREQ